MGVLDDLEALILPPARLQSDGVPSASIAILEDGIPSTHVITTGVEDADTLYQCGSISKAITALGVAKLVDRGRLSYDGRVADYLPSDMVEEVFDPRSAHLLAYVTIRMLITHTSGLSQPHFHGYPDTVHEMPSVGHSLAGRADSSTLRLRFDSFPGAQLLYTGGSFTLLQVAMEKICDMSFPDLMDELVFRPLGMSRSRYRYLPKQEANFTAPYLTGYHADRSGARRFPELAAVGMWSTPSDLLKVIAGIQNSLFAEHGYLKQETARQLLMDGVMFRSGPARHRCGLGFYCTPTVFGHRGANPGYHNYMFGFFDQAPSTLRHCGLAIMTNGLHAYDSLRRIVSAIFYLKAWPRQPLMPSSLGNDTYAPYAAPRGTEIDSTWRHWKGNWDDEWSLLEVNGEPALQLGVLQAIKLLPAAAPVAIFDDKEKTEVFLVADGLHDTAVRLTWQGSERVLESMMLAPKILRRRDEP